MKVFGYIIEEALNYGDLMKQVKDSIDEGWKPIGGVAVTSVITDMKIGITEDHFYQAMILGEDE